MNMKEAARAAKEKSAELMDKFRSKGSYMLHEDKIFFETLDDPDTVKQLLLHVVDGIDRGRVILANEEDEMVFYPGSLLKLTIRGKRAQSTSSIKMTVSWSRLDEDHATLDDEPPVKAGVATEIPDAGEAPEREASTAEASAAPSTEFATEPELTTDAPKAAPAQGARCNEPSSDAARSCGEAAGSGAAPRMRGEAAESDAAPRNKGEAAIPKG